MLFVIYGFCFVRGWNPSSWKHYPSSPQLPKYPDPSVLEKIQQQLKSFSPLVYAGECRRLKDELVAVEQGTKFLITGGDCAESFDHFSNTYVMNQYRLMNEMTLLLSYLLQKPIVRIGRIAGQFAKPRSELVETQRGIQLPSFQGDIINGKPFDSFQRTPDPVRMIRAYHQSCQTLNLLRALTQGEYTTLQLFDKDLDYIHDHTLKQQLQTSIQFLSGMKMMQTDSLFDFFHFNHFYVGHEGLLLPYEECLTRVDSITKKYYACSAHYLWLGERTRNLYGPHIEYFRGIDNPIGIKISKHYNPHDIIEILHLLNPSREHGKLSLIIRMGADEIWKHFPPLIRSVQESNVPVTWICDPMHANTKQLKNGKKTRFLYDIHKEISSFSEICLQYGIHFGGIHLEISSDPITECISLHDLVNEEYSMEKCYTSLCDPRLNPSQAYETCIAIAKSEYFRRNGGGTT
jgi:3-deoxy-7-phosphoheptulonate synthase